MRFALQAALVLAISLVAAQAQAPVASDAEKQELAAAVQEASTSGFDMIRALEAHLRKYPNTPLRRDMLPLLAKAAVDAKDEARIIQYGEPVLAVSPNEVTLLDDSGAHPLPRMAKLALARRLVGEIAARLPKR